MTNKLFDEDELPETEEVTIPEDEPLKPFLEKYKDPQGIAKALLEKDRFIAQLKGENAELRTEVVTRGKVDDALDRLLASKPNTPKDPSGTNPQDVNGDGTSKTGLTEDDVQRILSAEREKLVSEQNMEKTKALLKEAYGAEYPRVLVQKAKELGESAEFFNALARKNPAAVVAILGAPVKKKEEGSLLPPNGLNTSGDTLSKPDGSVRNYAYYSQLKQKDPKAYWSPGVQNQMHKDAIKLGPNFYSP